MRKSALIDILGNLSKKAPLIQKEKPDKMSFVTIKTYSPLENTTNSVPHSPTLSTSTNGGFVIAEVDRVFTKSIQAQAPIIHAPIPRMPSTHVVPPPVTRTPSPPQKVSLTSSLRSNSTPADAISTGHMRSMKTPLPPLKVPTIYMIPMRPSSPYSVNTNYRTAQVSSRHSPKQSSRIITGIIPSACPIPKEGEELQKKSDCIYPSQSHLKSACQINEILAPEVCKYASRLFDDSAYKHAIKKENKQPAPLPLPMPPYSRARRSTDFEEEQTYTLILEVLAREQSSGRF